MSESYAVEVVDSTRVMVVWQGESRAQSRIVCLMNMADTLNDAAAMDRILGTAQRIADLLTADEARRDHDHAGAGSMDELS